MLIWIILATAFISSLALVGIFGLYFSDKFLRKIILALVGLSAGVMLGGALLHLIPEALEASESKNIFLFVLFGFIVFFLLEKILHWRHCHKGVCPIHTFGYTNIVGDGVHNFIDGLIIAASFSVDFKLGLLTTLAVALHELPQEIGDFGVLIHAGFTKRKSLLLNFLAAVTVIFGGVIGFFLLDHIDAAKIFLLPFAAGGFLYIAAADLIPEIGKETKLSKSLQAFLIFLLGIFLMYLFKYLGE